MQHLAICLNPEVPQADTETKQTQTNKPHPAEHQIRDALVFMLAEERGMERNSLIIYTTRIHQQPRES